MDKITEAPLFLKEFVKAEVWRGGKGFYGAQPDETPEVADLITNAGRTFLANRIGGSVASAMAYMAIGSGSTAAALADTGLISEQKRKALSANSANTNNVYTAVCTFGGAADVVTSVQITEAGILNHASSGNGTLFQRVTFAAITLADSDLLKITLETNVGSNTI